MKDKSIVLAMIIDPDDDEALERASEAIGTEPEILRKTMGFSREVFAMAEERTLTRGQLVTAVMTVLIETVSACGDRFEQSDMSDRLFEGLRAALNLDAPTNSVH